MKRYIKDLIDSTSLSFLIKCETVDQMVVVSKFLDNLGFKDTGSIPIIAFKNNFGIEQFKDVLVETFGMRYLGTTTEMTFGMRYLGIVNERTLEINFKDVTFNNCITYEEEL